VNRLFLRILVLMTLAVFGSGALVWSLFDVQILPSENRQLESLVASGLTAVAERIAEGEDPAAVFDEVGVSVGDTLALVPTELLSLTAEERAHLEAGEVVVWSDGPQRRAWVAVAGRDAVVELEMLSFHSARAQWVGLPGTAGRPMTEAEQSTLTELERARLAWRPIVVDGARVVRRGERGLEVLDVPHFGRGRELGMAVTLLGVVVAIVLSLFPVRRELLALDRGAKRLREGDLSARVDVGSKVGPVGEVSLQVNAMADRVEALIASHEELLRSVSHELQTPLARLLFAVDALEAEPERRDELLAGMRVTTEEMRVLAEEVLQFNRLGQGQEQLLEREEVDLAELAGDVALTFDGTSVEVPEAGAFVQGDARLLYRALRNLVENAVVYGTPPVVRVSEDDGGVQVTVDDAGPGVPEAEWERVFQPFHRVEGSRARATGGTGLGLAIVARVVERHGGRVWVAESPEGGARFGLWLPRA